MWTCGMYCSGLGKNTMFAGHHRTEREIDREGKKYVKPMIRDSPNVKYGL